MGMAAWFALALVGLLASLAMGSSPAAGKSTPLQTVQARQTENARTNLSTDDAFATIAALQTRVADLEAELEEAREQADDRPTPTPAARSGGPTPTFDEIVADYPPIPDIRELAIRPGSLIGDRLAFSGTVLTIRVADEGRVWILGDDETFEATTRMQVTVSAPDGSTETVFVGYNGDTEGIFENSFVTVYGTVAGTQSGENALGGTVTQPLINAQLVVLA